MDHLGLLADLQLVIGTGSRNDLHAGPLIIGLSRPSTINTFNMITSKSFLLSKLQTKPKPSLTKSTKSRTNTWRKKTPTMPNKTRLSSHCFAQLHCHGAHTTARSSDQEPLTRLQMPTGHQAMKACRNVWLMVAGWLTLSQWGWFGRLDLLFGRSWEGCGFGLGI